MKQGIPRKLLNIDARNEDAMTIFNAYSSPPQPPKPDQSQVISGLRPKRQVRESSRSEISRFLASLLGLDRP